MKWIVAIVIVLVAYYKERLPELVGKFKKEMPNLVDAGKKMTKELKQKAQTPAKKTAPKEEKSDTSKTEE